MKARSRLTPRIEETTQSYRSVQKEVSALKTKYIKHLPLLFLALVFAYGVYQVITTVNPPTADVLHNQSYLILLLPVFFTSFFLISYLSLNSKLGVVFSLGVVTALYFRLQQFELNIQLFSFSFGIYFVCWGVLKLVWKITRR